MTGTDAQDAGRPTGGTPPTDRPTDVGDLRRRLRALPTFPAELPAFDPATAPPRPAGLFATWLEHAIDAGVPAPHAAVLSTVSRTGVVSARTLLLKDLDGDSWVFASHRGGPKGRDLAANPHAALTFFWPTLGRQVKVAGAVRRLPDEVSAADFAARPEQSRAASLVGRQSEPLDSIEALQVAYDAALARVRTRPGLVDESWAVYALDARAVEFWQSVPGRGATRWAYTADDEAGWAAGLLYP